MTKPRPPLDVVEQLVAKHRGDCTRPCDACELAAEVVALLRWLSLLSLREPKP